MKRRLLKAVAWTIGVTVAVGGCASNSPPIGPGSYHVEVGGQGLYMEIAGEGDPVVVFEAGSGADHAVWSDVSQRVRAEHQVTTLVYDRAGLGRSDPARQPYRIEDEAAALSGLLDRAGIAGHVILVAHSYGGWIASLVADGDPRVAGVVFVDANLPGILDDAGLERVLHRYRPQYDALRAARPELARQLIPTLEAYPASADRVDRVRLPSDLPIIDIVAEESWLENAADAERARRVHREFADASAARESRFAAGSGHNVMVDRPDVVISAIADMIRRVR